MAFSLPRESERDVYTLHINNQMTITFSKKQKELCHSEQAPALVVSAAMRGISAQYLTIQIEK
jgi:hypothetical protein